MKEYARVAECEIKYHPARCERPRITNSFDAAKILRDNWEDGEIEYRESVKVILMNRAGRVLGITTISQGGVDGATVDIKMALRAALLSNATMIILAHNHPSGNTNPSKPDDDVTSRLFRGCQAIDVKMFDHIIVTSENYYSYNDNGKLGN